MDPKVMFFLNEFDRLSGIDKIDLLNILVRDYSKLIEFCKLDYFDKRMRAKEFGDVAKEYIQRERQKE